MNKQNTWVSGPVAEADPKSENLVDLNEVVSSRKRRLSDGIPISSKKLLLSGA
jgi:hypothetical protein